MIQIIKIVLFRFSYCVVSLIAKVLVFSPKVNIVCFLELFVSALASSGLIVTILLGIDSSAALIIV